MSDHDAAVRERAEARVGTVLKDKWTIDSVLGVGGMATVYAATHRNSKRVAIKMLHPEVAVDPDIKTRFLREGYVANSVGHPGAVTVDDDDVSSDGAAFLVMELLRGETIQARAERKGGTLPVTEVLSLADQLLDVLGAAHAKGIVHRDLKPENLFLDKSGQLKVLDFGIARLRETRNQSGTRAGALLGTPAFMPPEQARGRWDEVDTRSDIWAVGATMFALITGRSVHEADTANELLALAITESAPRIRSIRTDLPPVVAALIDRALAYKKEDRFADAESMQIALRSVYAAAFPTADSPHRSPALSLPDVPPIVEAAAPPTPDAARPTTNLTTARGLSASVSTPRRPWTPILIAGAAGFALLAVGTAIAVGIGSRQAAETPGIEAIAPPHGQAEAEEQLPTPAATPSAMMAPIPAAASSEGVAPLASADSGAVSPAPKPAKPPTGVDPDPFARRR